MKKIIDFFKGVNEESKKIRWISKDEMIRSACGILVVSFFLMGFFIVSDLAINTFKELVFQ